MKVMFTIFSLFTLASCLPFGQATSKLEFDPGAVSNTSSQGTEAESPFFLELKVKILESKCLDCHGKMKDEKYVRTFISPRDAENSKLFEVLKDGSMPMGGEPLTTQELEIVRAYIDSVKPEVTPVPTPEPTPEPSPEPIPEPELVTFEKLKSQILAGKCISCHRGMNEEKNVIKFVIPGNPDNSKLFKLVKAGIMPKNAEPLSTKELELVRNYISGLKPAQ